MLRVREPQSLRGALIVEIAPQRILIKALQTPVNDKRRELHQGVPVPANQGVKSPVHRHVACLLFLSSSNRRASRAYLSVPTEPAIAVDKLVAMAVDAEIDFC